MEAQIEQQTRKLALAKYLECGAEDIKVLGEDTQLGIGSKEYLVLTDEEADGFAKNYIENSIWAFNASFILSECDLPSELEECIQGFQEKECEGANDALLALVEKCCGLETFVEDAIRSDGRGHFLASYDNEENEIELKAPDDEKEAEEFYDQSGGEETLTFYIYRTN